MDCFWYWGAVSVHSLALDLRSTKGNGGLTLTNFRGRSIFLLIFHSTVLASCLLFALLVFIKWSVLRADRILSASSTYGHVAKLPPASSSAAYPSCHDSSELMLPGFTLRFRPTSKRTTWVLYKTCETKNGRMNRTTGMNCGLRSATTIPRLSSMGRRKANAAQRMSPAKPL